MSGKKWRTWKLRAYKQDPYIESGVMKYDRWLWIAYTNKEPKIYDANSFDVVEKAALEEKDAQIQELVEALSDIVHGEPKEASTSYPYAQKLIEKHSKGASDEIR